MAMDNAALRRELTEILENQQKMLAKMQALMKPFDELYKNAPYIQAAVGEVQLSIANLHLQLTEMKK